MLDRRSLLLVAGLFVCLALAGVPAHALERLELTAPQETRVRRFLHPLPQELHLKGVAWKIAAGRCALRRSPNPDPVAGAMVSDFVTRWQERFTAALATADDELRIVAGLLRNLPALSQAAGRGLFDTKYLAERRHAEQAYAIATEASPERVTVYIAANEPPGLHYGLATFEQLLNALSEDNGIVYPHVGIVDWPDVGMRGSWTLLRHAGNGERALEQYERALRDYSMWKCNLVEAWHLHVGKVGEQGTLEVNWTFPKEVIDLGKRFGVTVCPGTGHLSRHAGRSDVRKHYPGAAATKGGRPQALCFGSPDARRFVEAYLEGIARKYDFADVWMSELEGPTGGCQCRRCKGNLRNQFVNEIKAIMSGYEKARKVSPSFRIMIGLTQGSAPHNHQVVQHIPKDLPINYYDGKVTYRVTFQRYNLPPTAQEIKRLGYTVGSTNSPGQTAMLFPFLAPQYCRMLAGEAEDRNLDFVLCEFWPSPFFHDLNAEAVAEFLWNSSGRTAEQFVVSWATRRGLENPEETAAVIGLIEYPSRALRDTKMREILPMIVDFVQGKTKPSTTVLHAFENRRAEEARRALALCDAAVARAERLKNPKLLAACRQVRYWMSIFSDHMKCVGKDPADPVVAAAKDSIRDAFAHFPEVWRGWLAQNPMSQYATAVINRRITAQQLIWLPIVMESGKLAPGVRDLLAQYESGNVAVMRLPSRWSFRTDKDSQGASAGYHKGIRLDERWCSVQVDGDFGWEKQGFGGYSGQAWYTTRWFSVLPPLRPKKHLYLSIGSIHGDAGIYVNAKKARTVRREVAAKPLLLDIRPYLPLGQKGLCIAVSVRGAGDTRGIVGPVFAVGCERPATADDIVPFVNLLP